MTYIPCTLILRVVKTNINWLIPFTLHVIDGYLGLRLSPQDAGLHLELRCREDITPDNQGCQWVGVKTWTSFWFTCPTHDQRTHDGLYLSGQFLPLKCSIIKYFRSVFRLNELIINGLGWSTKIWTHPQIQLRSKFILIKLHLNSNCTEVRFAAGHIG